MQVQVNTDKNITNSEGFTEDIVREIRSKLSKYSSRLTAVNVFLSDENSGKGGSDDKKCSIEARPEGLAPVAATHNAGSVGDSLKGAIQKIDRVIAKALS